MPAFQRNTTDAHKYSAIQVSRKKVMDYSIADTSQRKKNDNTY